MKKCHDIRNTRNGRKGKEAEIYDHGEKETEVNPGGNHAGHASGHGQRIYGRRDAGGTGGADAKRTLYSHQFL